MKKITQHFELNDLNEIQPEDLIVISALYSNDGKHPLSSFHGFDLVKEIRFEHKLRNPIVLFSPLPESYFQKRAEKESKYVALYDPAVQYIELPEDLNKYDNYLITAKPLSEAALADVCEMLYNLSGYLNDFVNHDLQPTLNQDEIKQIFQKIAGYLTDAQLDEINLNSWQHKINQSQGDEGNFERVKQAFLLELKSIFRTEDQSKEPLHQSPDRKYKVLLVEDNPKYAKTLRQNLGANFEIVHTASGSDAIKLLDDDDKNTILAVICDWRLYEADGKKWQFPQGYEVMEHAATTGFRAVFALTSLEEQNIHQIRNNLSIGIQLFKKQHVVNSSDWGLFSDLIMQKCKETVERIASLPNTAAWNKTFKDSKYTLKEEYIKLYGSANWWVIENEISETSKMAYNYLLSLSKPFPEFDPLKKYFGLEFRSGTPKIKSILIGRRIWLSLYYKKYKENGLDENIDKDIFLNMHPKYKNFEYRNTGRSYDQLKGRFGISDSFLSGKRFLPEEKAWLKKHGLM